MRTRTHEAALQGLLDRAVRPYSVALAVEPMLPAIKEGTGNVNSRCRMKLATSLESLLPDDPRFERHRLTLGATGADSRTPSVLDASVSIYQVPPS